MRSILPVLFALTCAMSCAAKEKPVAQAAMPPPPPPVLRLKAGGPGVAFTVPDRWRVVAAKDDLHSVIMASTEHEEEMAAILIDETAPADKLEAVTTAWATKVAETKLFHVTDIGLPTYDSDEESTFIVFGEDNAKRKMMLISKIKHVGANNADFWASVILTGSATQAMDLVDAGDRIAGSLHVVPQPSPSEGSENAKSGSPAPH